MKHSNRTVSYKAIIKVYLTMGDFLSAAQMHALPYDTAEVLVEL